MLSESYGMKFRSPAEVDFYLARTVATRMAAQYSSLETLKPSKGSQETVTGIPAGFKLLSLLMFNKCDLILSVVIFK